MLFIVVVVFIVFFKRSFANDRKSQKAQMKELMEEENKRCKVLEGTIREMKQAEKDRIATVSRLEERCIDAEEAADKVNQTKICI